MAKKLIKLTESDLHRIIKESVNKLLRDGYTNVVESNIKEGVEFQSNDPVEEWGYYQNKLQNEFDELGVLVLNKIPKNDPDRMIIQRYISMLQNHLHKLEKQF